MTGASSGIGFAITARLLQHNAAKIITLSSRKNVALESIEHLKTFGDVSRVVWYSCDLKELDSVDKVAKKLRDSEPRIDAVSIPMLPRKK